MGSVIQDPDDSQSLLQATVLDKSTFGSTRLYQDGGRVIPTARGQPPRVIHSSADRELLIQNVLRAVEARRTTIPQRSQERELELMLWDTFPVESITEEKTSPPVLQPVGGTIPLMNDQSTIPGFTDTRRWTGRSVGKRGMVRAGGSASRTQGARWTPNVQGFPALGSLTPDEEKRRDRAVPECSDVVVAQDAMMVPPAPECWVEVVWLLLDAM